MIARCGPARETPRAGRARVRSELLAERNRSYTTSELLFFSICHAERIREASAASFTVKSKHPYLPTLLQGQSRRYFPAFPGPPTGKILGIRSSSGGSAGKAVCGSVWYQ